jgi:uncharacterized membrane protein
MAGVISVRQIDDRRSHWHARVGGKSEEWDAVVQEQVPGEKIVWRNEGGAVNAGIVSFEPVVDGRTRNTRIHLEMAYEPEGLAERIGDALGLVERWVSGDLERFKEFIEATGSETGAWRGELKNPHGPGGHTRGRPREQNR